MRATEPYLVYDYPTDRKNKLLIVHKYNIQSQSLDKSWSDSILHISCTEYTITRCGDGVIDDEFEKCDDGEKTGLPGHCNKLCTGIIELGTAPSCDSKIEGNFLTNEIGRPICDVGIGSNLIEVKKDKVTNYSWFCSANGEIKNCTAKFQNK